MSTARKLKHTVNRVRLLALASREQADVVFRARRGNAEGMVALSFDDGPSEHNTPPLLDLLREHEATATFFAVGQELAGREEIAKRLVAEGHELANHTHKHPHPSTVSDDELRLELRQASEAIRLATDVEPKLARPPFGKERQRFARVAQSLGLRTVMWSIDSGDTAGYSAHSIARFVGGARNGDVVLLHDGGDLRTRTLEAAQQALGVLSARGFRCVSVSELLAAD